MGVPIMLMNQSNLQMLPSNVMLPPNVQIIQSSNVMMSPSNITVSSSKPSIIPGLPSLGIHVKYIFAIAKYWRSPKIQCRKRSVYPYVSFPPSVPSPATPSGKHYKETFFDEDVTLVKNAMVKVTKHINSVTSYRKNQVNMKFFRDFQVKGH